MPIETARVTPHIMCFRSAGTKPPLLLIAGQGGLALGLRALAMRFGPDQPVYGFDLPGNDSTEPLVEYAIEQTAALLEFQVLTHVKERDIALAGFSMGALVAAELANRLVRAGKNVLGLVSLDGVAPGFYRRQKSWPRHLATEALGLVSDLRAVLATVLRSHGQDLTAGVVEGPRRSRLTTLRTRAMVHYEPPANLLNVPLLVVVVSEPLPWLRGRRYPSDYGWSDYTRREIEILEVQGQHEAVISDPAISLLVTHAIDDFVSKQR